MGRGGGEGAGGSGGGVGAGCGCGGGEKGVGGEGSSGDWGGDIGMLAIAPQQPTATPSDDWMNWKCSNAEVPAYSSLGGRRYGYAKWRMASENFRCV